jgi:NodT family efflux transporter outer membrane factor (OMF) lipoprotein
MMKAPPLSMLAVAISAMAPLAGCSLAPDYKPPITLTPATYKESGPWEPAAPSDDLPRRDWWRGYGDETLDGLETRIDTENPDLAASLARYDEARAYLGETSASLLPSVIAGGSATTNRQSDKRPLRSANQPTEYGANTLDLQVGYELDLWGRVRNLVAAGQATAQARAADSESVRLSLHAELASDYMAIRGLDAELKLLADTEGAYARAQALTQDRFEGKIASGIDVSRAESQLQSARALASDDRAQRALLEHAIASLVGESASGFSLPAAIVNPPLPPVPTGIPAALLQRRPDIAAAERRVAAANAAIGVARAAFYPDITLNMLGGFQNTGSGFNLLAASYSFWSIGPGFTMPIFEGGLRNAIEAQTFATLREESENYRSIVLAAFQEVEDNLALLRDLGQEAAEEQAATQAAERTASLSLTLYKDGAVSYLDVVVAQTEALEAERTLLNLNTRRLQANIRLARAVGGGWSTADLPSREVVDSTPETAKSDS